MPDSTGGTGRTYWWAKDSAWWRRDRIVKLGLEFGANGPAVIDWLSCEAKAQNDGGRVKTGEAAIAHGSFVPLDVVSHVLSRAVTLGLLDDFEDGAGVFTCRVSGWQADQRRGQAAARQADKRERDHTETPDVEPDSAIPATVTSHAPSRPVTPRHAEAPTGQDRTEEQLPPIAPQGGRTRDLSIYEEEMTAWSRRNFPGVEPGLVRAAINRLRQRDVQPTVENLRRQGEHHPALALTAAATAA